MAAQPTGAEQVNALLSGSLAWIGVFEQFQNRVQVIGLRCSWPCATAAARQANSTGTDCRPIHIAARLASAPINFLMECYTAPLLIALDLQATTAAIRCAPLPAYKRVVPNKGSPSIW